MMRRVSRSATTSASGAFCNSASGADASSTAGRSLTSRRLPSLADQFVDQADAVGLVPANDATPEPLIKPIVIGGTEDAPMAKKKRGWWRR